MSKTAIGAGLEGVIAADSSICYIDGDAGILSYQGYDIHTLARNATFEEVIFLLWNGRLPKAVELDPLKVDLSANRIIPEPVTAFQKSVPNSPPMDVLRTAVSMLSLSDPDAADNTLAGSAQGDAAHGTDVDDCDDLRPAAQRKACFDR